jgi:hypothetical protein
VLLNILVGGAQVFYILHFKVHILSTLSFQVVLCLS